MSRLVLCVVAVVAAASAGRAAAPNSASPDPASLAVPPEQVAKARELVRQLGSEVFRDRDRAARELARMGRLALPALDAGRNDPDPEIQMRVAWLFPRAEADELRARVEAFLADTEAKYVHDLPGFRSFRAIAGEDRDARDLYAEALKNPANHELLLALRGAPADRLAGLSAAAGAVAAAGPERPPAEDLSLALNARRMQLQHRVNQPVAVGGIVRPYTPDLSDVALLLLAESLVPESKMPANPLQYQLATFLYQEGPKRASAGQGKHGPAFRKLLLHWMDTRDGVYGLTNAMSLARQLQLGPRVVSRCAARLLMVNGSRPWDRASAAGILAQFGGKEHLFALTRQFTDETELIRGGPNNPQPTIQVRDAALAMALLLTGQDAAKYGLDVAHPGNEGMKYQYPNYRFLDDDKTPAEARRAAAFAKWRAWEAGLHGSAAGSAAAAAVLAREYPEKPAKK